MPDRQHSGKAGKRQPRRPPTRNPAATDLRHRRRVLVRVLIGAMAVVALLFVFVFPARTLLAQRQQAEKQKKTLELLNEQSRKLAHLQAVIALIEIEAGLVSGRHIDT